MPSPSRGVNANTESSVRIAASHWASSIFRSVSARARQASRHPSASSAAGKLLLVLLSNRQAPASTLILQPLHRPRPRTGTRRHAQTARPARACGALPAAPCPAATARYGRIHSWLGDGLSLTHLRPGQDRVRPGFIRENSSARQPQSQHNESPPHPHAVCCPAIGFDMALGGFVPFFCILHSSPQCGFGWLETWCCLGAIRPLPRRLASDHCPRQALLHSAFRVLLSPHSSLGRFCPHRAPSSNFEIP